MKYQKWRGYGRIITFDMGGTSTDVALIDGALPLTLESSISNYPVKVPMIDIHTVGAGGGSLAYKDVGGSLKVGPESAGADPGPICYGKGEQITVTDANLYPGTSGARTFPGRGHAAGNGKARKAFPGNGARVGPLHRGAGRRHAQRWPTPTWKKPSASYRWSAGSTPGSSSSFPLAARGPCTPRFSPNCSTSPRC